jgi:hypothetical protein
VWYLLACRSLSSDGNACGKAISITTRAPAPSYLTRVRALSGLGLLNLAKTYGEQRLEAACRRALTLGSPTRKRIEAILEAKLDQHPDLFPGADTAAPTASRSHANVRGADYFRATTQAITPSTTEGDDDPCSSNPLSMH